MQRALARGGRRQRYQPRDLALAVEDALALHLGRMRGEHRADAGACKPAQHRLPVGSGALQRVPEAARAARGARLAVGVAPAILMGVLGDVEQVREVAERTHHVQRFVDRQRVEAALELRLDRRRIRGERRVRLRPAKAHCGAPDRLDAAAGGLAHLLGDHVPEQAAEQPPVFPKRLLLVFRATRRRGIHAATIATSPSGGATPGRRDRRGCPGRRSRTR